MIYADSTFTVACKVRDDTFHAIAERFYEERQTETWLWSPWHRIEVFNTIRHLTRHPDAARRLHLSEAKALIHRLEEDVRVGYFKHEEADWRDVMRAANLISAAHAFSLPCRSADLLHVAYARELSAEMFVSFDDDQLALADAVGLKTVRPKA
ncbi:MAG: PIN domain-containing protein [Verrucomicrobia bacterium]|nr:PIN domain-containing protein [Verrucomicrobiota bacterium]